MAQTLPGTANNYDFGQEFDYSLWVPGTQIDLVNVNWNNDYKDVVRFPSANALDQYIDSLEPAGIRIGDISYVKPNMPIRLNIPHNRANRFNYLRASNPLQPIGGDLRKTYYYFILDTRYVAPNTTELIVQLDVFQTYVYDAEFGNCYVERGHIGIANEKQFDAFGRDYLTVPEGIDLGADYRVITKRTDEIMGFNDATLKSEVDVLVFSTVDLNGPYGVESDSIIKGPQGSTINSLPSGAGAYIFESTSDFTAWMWTMRDFPWITQGIISITAVPKLTRYGIPFEYADNAPKHANINPRVKQTKYFPNWRDSDEIKQYIPQRYWWLRKLWTAPYMVIEMTTWSATPVVLRPEAWQDPDAHVLERPVYMPPNQRVQFSPRKYNSSGQNVENYAGLSDQQIEDLVAPLPIPDDEKVALKAELREAGDDFGDYLDVMTQVANFPAMPAVNNMAISYLASNQHSIAYSREAADWSQQRALNAAQGQYDIAARATQTARELSGIGVMADIGQTANANRTAAAQAAFGAMGDLVGGAATGAAFGGGPGAAAGAIQGAARGASNGMQTGIQIASNDQALAIRNRAAGQSVNTQNEQGMYAANTNRSLAEFAAKGDYANTIAGINAKVQDARMIQPSISGQYGGDAANIAHGTLELSIRWKMIDIAAIRVIGEFWLRYGYAVRATIKMPQSLMVMSNFTYWKCAETYIISATMPESFKQTLRGIFEKGVTVWANPADIGTIDYANNFAIPGVSY